MSPMTPFFCNTSSLFERKTKRETLLSWCFQEGSVCHKPIRYCIAIYSHSIRKGGKITQPPHDIHFRRNRIPYESLSTSTSRENGASRRPIETIRHASDDRKAGRPSKAFAASAMSTVGQNCASFSRRTRSGSSTANATNRHTCDRGRIPQPNRIRLWPSVGRHSFPQHRPHGAAEYQREAHGRMRG